MPVLLNFSICRVRLPTVSNCCRGRWLQMNHREKSPSRFAPIDSVGLFTAAIPGLPVWIEPGRFANMGPALRADPCVTWTLKRHGTLLIS